MNTWWPAASLLFGIAALAADAPPEFTAAGLARGTRPARMVVPGTFLTIYGQHLAPPPGQCAAAVPPSNYPIEICGTQVLIGDRPAQLLYVGDKQINFKVPQDSPLNGTVDVRVIYNGQSSRSLTMKAGFELTAVSLDGDAYAGMPIWVKIDLPFEWEGATHYPGKLGRAHFGCNEVEVRRNGQLLPLLPGSDWSRYGFGGSGNPCGSFGPVMHVDRLPLHLLYRLDVPGTYEVRYTLRSVPVGWSPQTEFRARSEWTAIQVLPATPTQRAAWLRTVSDRAPGDAAELLTDTLPSLMGVPDDASLEILAGYLYHPDDKVRRYAMDGLFYWPGDAVSQKLRTLLDSRGPSDVVTRYLSLPLEVK